MAQKQDESPHVAPRVQYTVKRRLHKVADFAAKGKGSRAFLASVHVGHNSAGQTQVQSTNGQILVRATETVEPPADSTLNGLAAYVPAQEWAKILKATPRADYQGNNGTVTLTPTEKTVSFAFGTSTFTVPQIASKFPNVDSVMPKGDPVFTVIFDPAVMAQAIGALSQLTDSKDAKFEFYGTDKPLKVSGADPDYTFEVLVMPRRG